MTQDMNKQIMRRDVGKYCFLIVKALSSLSFLLLMLCLGVNEAWGQETTDYSGVYYIGSKAGKAEGGNATTYAANDPTNNFYLCPTEGWYYYVATNNFQTDSIDQPFLTTYKCKSADYHNGDPSDAVWIVRKHPTETDCYYIIQKSTGRYMISNGQISGSSNANRIRVHLETVADPTTLDDKALFEITYDTDHWDITPHSTEGQNGNNIYLVVNNGNFNNLKADRSKDDGPNGAYGKGTGGIISLFTHENNARFHLEDYIQKPTIFYNTSNQIEITVQDDATIIYTTDESDPKDPTNSNRTVVNNNTTTFPIDEIKTIKAVAVVSGFLSKDITTFTPPVVCGDTYLIQSQNNAWDTDKFHFYMIPGDDDKVNTTSLFRPSMEWHFAGAGMENGIQYYYVVNNANSKYLCYDATNSVYMDTFSSDNDNTFKFRIMESPTAGTYNIRPYGNNNYLNKANSNDNLSNINLNNSNTSGNTRWKFVTKDALDQTAPFTVSDASTTFYYKINSVGSNGYYIVPPSGTNTNATTSNNSTDDNVIKTGAWYFEVAQEASETDWLTYYYIRNAETGKYLYFTRDDNNADACLEMRGTIESENKDRYMFTWAKTANTSVNYYIIPKLLKDASLNQISSLQRNNGKLQSNPTRGAGNYAWTFTLADLFCNDPVFNNNEENGPITISCVPDITRIYYTTDGTEPNPGDETQRYTSTTSLSASDQLRIKAIAFVSNGTNSASSSVITLLNKPDITLEAEPYEYKSAAWTPSVSTVSIGESGSETIAPTSPATYTTTYTDNVNAGTATVTLTDVEGDLWYIWNGSTTFTIDQKAITITADSDTKEYDGTPLTKNSYTYSPVLATGDSFESVTITGSQTAVGSNSNVPSAAIIKNGSNENVTANYDITFVNGTLEVTVRSIGDGINPASGFTLEFGEGGALIIKDGEIALTENTDFTEATTESGKYATRTVSGKGNYNGSFTIRNAKVNFQNDGNGGTEYSATFVAESAAGSTSNDPDKGHQLPEGITAYIITSISGNNANAEALGYIPEGVPVLLLSNAASGGFLVQDASGHTGITSDQINNNMLEEVTAETSGYVSDSESEYYQKAYFDTRKIYLLYMNEFVYNMAGYLAKGKVYLNPSHNSGGGGGGGNSRLQIRWDTETGIDDSHFSPLPPHLSGPWYTLDGRRLSGKPTQKGLYLCNGQKTVVR